MPRKTENRAFIENRYRYLATYKGRNAGMMMQAVDRLAVMCGFLQLDLTAKENKAGEKPVVAPVDNKVQAMLEQAARDRKRGGVDAKLSDSSS
jgi:uncharacterized protein YunC (DUF1805 family)